MPPVQRIETYTSQNTVGIHERSEPSFNRHKSRQGERYQTKELRTRYEMQEGKEARLSERYECTSTYSDNLEWESQRADTTKM